MAWCCKECGSEKIERIKDIMEERRYKIKILKNGKVKEGKFIGVLGEIESDCQYYRCGNCGNKSDDGYGGELGDIAEWKNNRRTK